MFNVVLGSTASIISKVDYSQNLKNATRIDILNRDADKVCRKGKQ